MKNKLTFKKTTSLQAISISENTSGLLALVEKDLKTAISVLSGMELSTAINEGTQISSVKREQPELYAVSMSALIGLIDARLNLKRKLDAGQISDIANSIAKDFWHLKFEEVYHVIEKGIKGHYNPEGFFSEIDVMKILGWFRTYDNEERAQFLEVAASQYKRQEKEVLNDVDENYIELMKKVLDGSKTYQQKLKEEQERKFNNSYNDYMEKLKQLLPEMETSELISALNHYRQQKATDHAELVEAELLKQLPELEDEQLNELWHVVQFVPGEFARMVGAELGKRDENN